MIRRPRTLLGGHHKPATQRAGGIGRYCQLRNSRVLMQGTKRDRGALENWARARIPGARILCRKHFEIFVIILNILFAKDLWIAPWPFGELARRLLSISPENLMAELALVGRAVECSVAPDVAARPTQIQVEVVSRAAPAPTLCAPQFAQGGTFLSDTSLPGRSFRPALRQVHSNKAE